MVDVPIECRLAVNYLPPLLNWPDLNTCLSVCKRVLLRVVASCRYLKDTRFTELYRQYYRHSYGRLQKLYCFVRATKTFIFNDGVTFVLNCSVSRESRQTKWLIWRSGPLYTGHLHEHRHFLWLIEILLIRIITLTWEQFSFVSVWTICYPAENRTFSNHNCFDMKKEIINHFMRRDKVFLLWEYHLSGSLCR